MAPTKNKSKKSSKPASAPQRRAGAQIKQPPTKAVVTSSRQSESVSKGAAAASKKKRKAAEALEEEGDGEDREDGERDAIIRVPVLKARVRNIPQAVVKAKWGFLSEKGQEEIKEVLMVAERPVLMTFREGNKRAEAQDILHGVMSKLRTALPKIPVPPTGKDVHLNLEKLIDKNRALEALLEPDLRQIAELEAEIKREEKAKNKDEMHLKDLKKNAEIEEKIRRQKSRSIHPLLQRKAGEDSEMKDRADDINLVSSKSALASSYDASVDRQIGPLTVQLQNHLSSMQGNSALLGDVTEWMQRSRAAVDEVLFLRASDGAYDGILGL